MDRIILLLLLFPASICLGQNLLSVKLNYGDGINVFSSVQEAIDAAQDGDIIQIYPGTYPGFTVDKPLIIYGSGFRRLENYPSDLLNGSTVIDGDVSFTSDAATSVVGSFSCEQIELEDVNLITLDRIDIQTKFSIRNCADIIVKSCHVTTDIQSGRKCAVGLSGTTSASFLSTLFLSREEWCNFGCSHISYSIGTTTSDSNVSVAFNHCLFMLNPSFSYGSGQVTFSNSIFSRHPSDGGGAIQYDSNNFALAAFKNVFRINSAPSQYGPNNLGGVDYPDLFVGPGSFDGQYQLLITSPAKGHGTNGSDCGPYGGDNAYVPSGLPRAPIITRLDLPPNGTTGAGMQVSLKGKTQN